MDWQSIFYILGSLFIFGWLLLLIFICLMAWQVYRTVKRMEMEMKKKMESPLVSILGMVLPVLVVLLPILSGRTKRS